MSSRLAFKEVQEKMEQRIDYTRANPSAVRGMFELERHTAAGQLESSLVELVRLRASQLNGCAYCIDVHATDARRAGESEQRLYALSAWRSSPFYTERERAALAWTEALTLIAEGEVSDSLYETVRKHFDEHELVALTMVVIAINGWNRLTVAFRQVTSTHQTEKSLPK